MRFVVCREIAQYRVGGETVVMLLDVTEPIREQAGQLVLANGNDNSSRAQNIPEEQKVWVVHAVLQPWAFAVWSRSLYFMKLFIFALARVMSRLSSHIELPMFDTIDNWDAE